MNWFVKAWRGEMEPTVFNFSVVIALFIAVVVFCIFGVLSANHYSTTGTWVDDSFRIVRVEQLSENISYRVERSTLNHNQWHIMKSFSVNPTTGDELEAYDKATEYWLKLIEANGQTETKKVLKKYP